MCSFYILSALIKEIYNLISIQQILGMKKLFFLGLTFNLFENSLQETQKSKDVKCVGTNCQKQIAKNDDNKISVSGYQKSGLSLVKQLQQNFMKIDKALMGFSKKDEQFQTIYFLGCTGSGKSTLINYLLKAKMHYSFDEFSQQYKVNGQKKDEELPKIGNAYNSQTVMPKSFCDNVQNLCYVDTPGFMNTKGSLEQILDSYSNARIFQKGNKVKIVLVIDQQSIKAGRGQFIIEGMKKIKQMFPNNMYDALQSTSIIISKAKTPEVLDPRLYQMLNKILEDKKTYQPEITLLLKDIIVNQRVFAFPVPSKIKQQTVVELIKKLHQIKPHSLKSDAQLNISPQGKLMIEDYVQTTQNQLTKSQKIIQQKLQNNFLLIPYKDSSQLSNKILQVKKATLMIGQLDDTNLALNQTYISNLLTLIEFDNNQKNIFLQNIKHLQFCHFLHQNIQTDKTINNIINKFNNAVHQLQIKLQKISNKEYLDRMNDNHNRKMEELKRQIQRLQFQNRNKCQLI